MDPETLALLARGHAFFGAPAGGGPGVHSDGGVDQRLSASAGVPIGGAQQVYAADVDASRARIGAAVARDKELRAAIADVVAAHDHARQESQRILEAARADGAAASDTPMGQREALARRLAYVRAQRDLVLASRAHSRRAAARLRALRYRRRHGHRRHGRGRLDPRLVARLGHGRGASAVKEALTQLGVPYVWGGNAWGRGVDCSSLVQGAWAHVGVGLPRTTWDQIHVGVAVPVAHVAAGDLVFPASAHGGHVQMYVGGGKVIEAPYSGASVRIVDMPHQVMAIRRPG